MASRSRNELGSINFGLQASSFRPPVALLGVIALIPAAAGQEPVAHSKTRNAATVRDTVRTVKVDLSEQMIYFQEKRAGEQDFRTVKKARITTGMPRWNSRRKRNEGVSTPTGTFTAGAMGRMRNSSRYDDAPMPYYIHVYKGIYLHQGVISKTKQRLSHGCVRMSHATAKWASTFVKIGDRIVIQR